jgi:hypothetical protein
MRPVTDLIRQPAQAWSETHIPQNSFSKVLDFYNFLDIFAQPRF